MEEGKVWSPDDLAKLRKMMEGFVTPPKRGVFDFTINVQMIFAGMVAIIFTMGGWGIHTLIDYSSFQKDFTALQTQVQSLNTNVQGLSEQLNIMRTANIQLRDQLSKWQDAAQLHDLDQQKAISSLDKNLAVIQERFDERLPKAPGPHGEKEVPDKFGSLK